MKFRTTQKAIRANYTNIIKVGYCGLQTMLNYKSPIAYTTRPEGWGCDIYEISPNTVISTGYAPFGNIKPGYEVCRKYDQKAREIINTHSNNMIQELDNLIQEFRKEVVK